MSQPEEPIELDAVEYYEPPASRPEVRTGTVVVEGGALPCCPGCGCLLTIVALIVLFNFDGAVAGLVLLAAAAWVSATLLRTAGISRVSPVYVYALVPLFLTVANLGFRFLRGEWAYSAGQIALGTGVIYAFLWVAQRFGRRG